MIRPSGTDPFVDQSFSTIPTRLLAMWRKPASSQAAITARTAPTVHTKPPGIVGDAPQTGAPDEAIADKIDATCSTSGEPTVELLSRTSAKKLPKAEQPEMSFSSLAICPDTRVPEAGSALRSGSLFATGTEYCEKSTGRDCAGR
jgi:hypothetical protein